MKLFEAGSLWSYKGFRLFWFSNTIFVIGAGAFPVALAVVVLDNNGNDPKSLGFVLGARVLAAVLFSHTRTSALDAPVLLTHQCP